MAKAIANLRIQLTAVTGQFTKGIKGAQAQVTGFAKKIRGMRSGLSGTTKALIGLGAGFLGVRGLSNAIKESLTNIDNLAKSAQKIGTTTDALSALRHAASLSGVEAKTLDTAMQKMLDSIADAGKGTGEAADSFEALRINIADIRELNAEDQLIAIAGALQDVTNQADKVDIVRAIFGRAGADLIPLLAEGEAGIRKLTDEARKLGIVVSGTDAAKVEAANDAMESAQKVVTGLVQTLTIEFAPALENMAVKFQEWATSGVGAAQKIERALLGLEFTFRGIQGIIGGGLDLLTFGHAGRGMQEKASSAIDRIRNRFNQIEGERRAVRAINTQTDPNAGGPAAGAASLNQRMADTLRAGQSRGMGVGAGEQSLAETIASAMALFNQRQTRIMNRDPRSTAFQPLKPLPWQGGGTAPAAISQEDRAAARMERVLQRQTEVQQRMLESQQRSEQHLLRMSNGVKVDI